MKKTLLWSTAILSMLTLTGCGSSNDNQSENKEKTEQSSHEKSNTNQLMDEAKKAIDKKQFHVAKEKLETIQKENRNDEQVKAMLSQIDNYQKAKDKMSDKKYKEADRLAQKVEEEANGSIQMQDYADELSKEIASKMNPRDKKVKNDKEANRQSDKNDKEDSNSSVMSSTINGKNLSDSDKEAIDKAMVAWCKSQAHKGGMDVLGGTFFPHGSWSTEDTRVVAKTPDGDVLLFDGSEDNHWQPKSGDINAIGGAMFYFPGTKSNGTPVGPNYISPDYYAKKGTQVDYYLWADNGKVYELKVNNNKQGVGSGDYNVDYKNMDVKRREPCPEYIVSEDKAAIAEYQRLLKQYGGSEDVSSSSPSSKSSSNQSEQWDEEKSDALSSFMATWENKMGQRYEQSSLNSSDNTVITKNTLSLVGESDYTPERGVGILKINGQQQPVSVSLDGKGNGYQIVDCYSGLPGEGDEAPYVYLFVLNNGKPEVLFCDITKDIETSGNKAYANFKPTGNQALKQGFADIVNDK